MLHFVHRYPGLRVAELLQILKITKQSLARVLRELVAAGHVVQQTGPSDRRERLLYTTKQGAALADQLARPQIERIARTLAASALRRGAERGKPGQDSARMFLYHMITPEERAAVDALMARRAIQGRAFAPESAAQRFLMTATGLMAAKAAPLADNAPHILIVDDDKRIRDLLAQYLASNGFRVTTASDAETARATMRGLTFDLMILDVMMPGESGLEFARSLRQTLQTPILMLTARADSEQRIEGLEAGVDDYMPKPFEARELLLRLHNILRRREAKPVSRDDVRMGEFVFTISRGELKRGDETIKLTERERDLMRLFAQRAGTPIARHELIMGEATNSERAVDVQINRLRRKIEVDPSNPVFLQTARGKGYILYAD